MRHARYPTRTEATLNLFASLWLFWTSYPSVSHVGFISCVRKAWLQSQSSILSERSDLWYMCAHSLAGQASASSLLQFPLSPSPPPHITFTVISFFYNRLTPFLFSLPLPLLPSPPPPIPPFSVCLPLFLSLPLSVVGSLPGTMHIPSWKIWSFVQTPASKICPEKSHMAVSTLQTSPFDSPPLLLTPPQPLKHPPPPPLPAYPLIPV